MFLDCEQKLLEVEGFFKKNNKLLKLTNVTFLATKIRNSIISCHEDEWGKKTPLLHAFGTLTSELQPDLPVKMITAKN